MKIQITAQYGSGKEGTVYEQGLYDIPNYYKATHLRDDFYWDIKSKPEDNAFLLKDWLRKDTYIVL